MLTRIADSGAHHSAQPAAPGALGRGFWVLVAVWLGLIAIGMTSLFRYQLAAGATATAPPQWPAGTALEIDPDVHTLVMVAHPKCVCTRASIAELSRLMTRLEGRLEGYVLFVRPEGITEESWEETHLWRSASIIEGIQVVRDPGGTQAARFGARTSGHTYLYDPAGRLLFSGGITPARGHQGDSIGRQRIISLVAEGEADRPVSDTYGCPVFGEGEAPAERAF